jgi:hypothetical protein
LEGLDADVLCVQEIEQDQFSRFFLPALAARGCQARNRDQDIRYIDNFAAAFLLVIFAGQKFMCL